MPGWRFFLLERHLDRCPKCQGCILDDEAIRAMGTTAAALQAELPLWPVPAARPKAARTLRLRWRYAFGLSLVAALVCVAITVIRFAPTPSVLAKGTIREIEEIDESKVFAVLSAEIGAEPARSVIFKPRQPGMTIVWFEKIIN
ncbi:MAG: hypothetical protein NTW95_03275 [Candidatus Aminicenantes bacterium]|nr:hypothetical protein [Candidatus Aminicenantes bacterium]